MNRVFKNLFQSIFIQLLNNNRLVFECFTLLKNILLGFPIILANYNFILWIQHYVQFRHILYTVYITVTPLADLNNCGAAAAGCCFYCNGCNNSSMCCFLHTKWHVTTNQRWAFSCHRDWKCKMTLQRHGVTGTNRSSAFCVEVIKELQNHISTQRCTSTMLDFHTGLPMITR